MKGIGANASYVPRVVLLTPGLAASRTQTPKCWVPAGAPVVFQLQVDAADQPWTTRHVLPSRNQNSYTGLGLVHPTATAVKLTCAPVPWAIGEAGDAEMVTEPQDEPFTTYGVLTTVSYAAGLLVSLAQTPK